MPTQDILINWSPQETRVAVVENGAVQELHIERTLERGQVGNVYLGRSLGFVVTPKTRQAGGPAWGLIRPQLIAIGLLAGAGIVGVVRMAVGQAPVTPTLVNLAWIVFDLVVLSVIVQAARYQGYDAGEVQPEPARALS